MNKIILIVLFCVAMLDNSALAQEEDVKDRNQEFAFNCTPLISNLIPFENNIRLNNNDFMLIYKKRKSGNQYSRKAISLNLGGGINLDREQVLLKIGTEYKYELTKSWVAHTGYEFYVGANSATSAFSFSTELGAAGIYGIQWMLNERMALGTEGYLTFGIVERDDASGLNLEFRLPKSILLSIYF